MLVALVLSACDGSSSLVVDLRTDLRPGRQFALVQTEVVDGSGASQMESTTLDETDDTLVAARIAELDVANGDARVTVTLSEPGGAALLTRTVAVRVQGPTAVTVLMTSDCVGVDCGGDTPECVNGQCVAEGCSPENPDACGETVCASDADCPAVSECTRGQCSDSLCISVPDDSMCGVSEFCAAVDGCVNDPEPADAGPGEPDAGPGEPDAGAEPCMLPPGAIVAFDPEQPIPAGWECISCNAGEPLFERFPLASGIFGMQGGEARHSHTVSVSESAVAELTVRVTASGTVTGSASGPFHVHPMTMTTTASAAHLPPFTVVRYLRATEATATVPEGAILAFDTAEMPPGYVQAAMTAGRFLRGGDAGGLGGAESHIDEVVITLPPSTTAVPASQDTSDCTAAVATHTHMVDGDVSEMNDPLHVALVMGRPVAANTPLRGSPLVMFAVTPPAPWSVVSADGTPLHGRLLRSAAAPDLSSDLGRETHGDARPLTSGPPNEQDGFAGTATCDSLTDTRVAGGAHMHRVIATYSTATSMPPFTSVILARRDGC